MLSLLEEDCMYQLDRNASVGVVVTDVKASLCPDDCNNNGQCVDGLFYSYPLVSEPQPLSIFVIDSVPTFDFCFFK